MIYQLVVALSIAAAASAKLFVEEPKFQQEMWESFKAEFDKVYESEEIEARRFGYFLENLKIADSRNAEERAAGGSAVYGTTRFSDLTQAEFEARYLTSDPSMKTENTDVATFVDSPDASAGLIDWSGKYTTAVKDQGYCGSCWAFSATEQIESDVMRTLGTTYILSPEQITQCDKKSQGCNGGWTERAYDYVKGAGGIETEKDYPYTSKDGTTGTCHSTASKFVIAVKGYTTIKGETNMATYVQKTGPLSVCVDASKWNSYKGGIVTSCGTRVDHCVQAVGVDASSSGYWKVRNSWGPKWGESGYIRLAYGKNTCAITNDPTYTTVAKK